MSQSNNKSLPELFNVGKLLTTDAYIIPMYQRNYAWEEGEITQLIQDVVDYQKEHPNSPYYIGTLVVHKREDGKYETIDGQQRLTTLTLLAAWLKNYPIDFTTEGSTWPQLPNIAFDNRENSSRTFAAIFNNTTKNLAEDSINSALLNGYQIIDRELPKLSKQHNVDQTAFATYLLNKVQIMRVDVPHDTDLNHYFEIMNNRGEQLEKHEVLKANLLSVLENGIADATEKAQSKASLNMIWEACANMEKYVQTGFSSVQRDAVFGAKSWNLLAATDFDDLCRKLNPVQETRKLGGQADEGRARTLIDIINSPPSSSDEQKSQNQDEAPQRFNSVINFPNFLLQALRIYLKSQNDDSTSMSIDEISPLDDKRLLSSFQNHLLQEGQKKVERVKGFAFALLRCKYLYDHYIIKREFIKGSDGWSLKYYKWNEGNKPSYVNTFGAEEDSNGENRNILMLLAAFHVSTPTQVYKHWLSGALNWLYRQSKLISAEDYLHSLESQAKAFMRDRFLVTTDKKEYSEIIYANQAQPKSDCPDHKKMVECLSYGEIENNFVFNYLDYMLWKQNESEQKKDARITNFEFTFRSSVEHFYPQHPLPGHEEWGPDQLNAFGNLCLISNSKNSRLSNYMPQAKKEHYDQGLIDSVKQYQMMKAMVEGNGWSPNTMWAHQKEMVEVITTALTA